jgi:hypothetical protein
MAEYEQGGVRLGLNKSQGEEVRGEPVVPSQDRLLQPIERFVEAVDPIKMRGINKPHQLAVVDCLQESSILEYIINVKLVNGPRA